MREKGITRVSSKDLHKMKDLTDWDALRAMTDEDIERAVASDPDTWIPTEDEWANARVVWPAGKEPISIRVDREIVQWFGHRGLDYGAEINAVLREYIEAQQHPRKGPSRSSVAAAKKHPRRATKRAAVKS